MKEEIILIVPPYTYRTDSYIAAARKLGLATLCAIDPSYGVPEGVEDYFPIPFDDPMSSAGSLVDYAMGRHVRAVVSIDDGGGEIASLTSEALGFAHNSLQAINAANNKHCMRVLLDCANVASPSFGLYRICENPLRISRTLEYPIVVKPLFLSGSRGVIRANNPDEFVTAFRRVSELLSQPGTGPDPKSVLIEQYIPGVEVSLEGVLDNGKLLVLGLYDKPDPLEGPFFEETLFIKPSRLPNEMQSRVIRCAEQALKAVGLVVGPVQVELRVNEGGPWIVEFAARTMGGHCSRALPFKDGLTLEELVLSQACGFDTQKFIPEPGAHGVMMIPIPGEGIYRGVSGVKEAEAVPGITGVMITALSDSIVTPLPEGDKYVGFIFAKGESPDEVESALRTAHSQLEFDIDAITRVKLRIVQGSAFGNQEMIRAQFGAIAQEYLRPISDGLDTGRAREFYQSPDILGLPRTATASSLGCGNPSQKAHFRPGETVLDLGCGGGIDSLIAAKAVGEAGRVIGIDMVDCMVLLARHNQAKMGLHHLEFLQGEIEDLPLPEATVDVVISNDSVNLSPDKDAVFREMFRVLKPGGRFVICDMAADESLSEVERRDLFVRADCLNGALTPSEFIAKLQRHGFMETQIDSVVASDFSSAALRVTVVGRKPDEAKG